jgi:hypothetical protein
MEPSEGLRVSDAAVVSRYLHLRSEFHDRLLARVEKLIRDQYDVQPTRRLSATLVALTRLGFVRPEEGELWPVVFLTPVDITLALCVQLDAGRLASLGTVLKGPQRLRHRHWEDWWGWETALAGIHPQFFALTPEKQEGAMLSWYADRLEWLTHNGLLARKASPATH